jgi:TatD DNase family protein
VWIDSHCHLDSTQSDLTGVLQRAADAGVEGLITLGTDLESSRRAIELASTQPRVWAAVGVHPHEADSFDRAAQTEIERLTGEARVVAVGEVGLDFYRNLSSPEKQRAAFADQVQIAKRAGKTLVMHVREAYREIFELLLEVGPPKGLVFHCFSGDRDDARRALDLGGFISFAGNVSYKSAEPLREAARSVPLNRLLVETDSPYLAPHPHRGKPNEPAYVTEVGRALAQAVGKPVEVIAEATSQNAAEVFNLPLTGRVIAATAPA